MTYNENVDKTKRCEWKGCNQMAYVSKLYCEPHMKANMNAMYLRVLARAGQ